MNGAVLPVMALYIVAGEEQGVDQLRLAAGEFADEGDGQLILAEQGDAALQLGMQVVRVQVVLAQPALVAHDFADDVLFPGVKRLNLLGKSTACHS